METGSEFRPLHPKLNKNFVQSLWYDSENGIISRKIIENKLYAFFNNLMSIEKSFTERRITKGFQHIIQPKSQFIAGKILGQIGVQELNNIHRAIKKSETEEEKQELSDRQIDLIVQGVEIVLAGEMREEEKEIVRKLLS